MVPGPRDEATVLGNDAEGVRLWLWTGVPLYWQVLVLRTIQWAKVMAERDAKVLRMGWPRLQVRKLLLLMLIHSIIMTFQYYWADISAAYLWYCYYYMANCLSNLHQYYPSTIPTISIYLIHVYSYNYSSSTTIKPTYYLS